MTELVPPSDGAGADVATVPIPPVDPAGAVAGTALGLVAGAGGGAVAPMAIAYHSPIETVLPCGVYDTTRLLANCAACACVMFCELYDADEIP